MKKKKEMTRVDTMDREDPWRVYWEWWNSDRPEARLELKLKPQPRQRSSSPTSLKTLTQRGLARFLPRLQQEPKTSH